MTDEEFYVVVSAALNGHFDIIDCFYNHGADINAKFIDIMVFYIIIQPFI